MPEAPVLPVPDPEFEASERLFRRIHPVFYVEGSLSEGFIPFPAFSVNREKYSSPEDVIAESPHFGIASFRVVDIPERLVVDSSRGYEFGVEHVPETGNYAHSEVRSYSDGVMAEPPKSVRKRFRDLLRRRITILRAPNEKAC
jgi:hypothetical protein